MHFPAAENQPEHFEFSKESLKKIEAIIAKYPEGRQASAAIPALDITQRQCGGWLPRVAIEALADLLGMPVMRLYEVATFYSMFNLAPVGDYFVQVCRTTPCWLRGSDKLVETCKKKLGVGLKETTRDGKFTVVEVECLGACANAPMVQINDEYFEDLDSESMEQLLDDLKAGKAVRVGSQNGRACSAPAEQLTSLEADELAQFQPRVMVLPPNASTNDNTPKKPAAKKTTAKKPAAKKPAAKKEAPAKKATAKTEEKKSATKKDAAKKTTAKKAATKKPAAKKPTQKKES